jgi:hypothetical protein
MRHASSFRFTSVASLLAVLLSLQGASVAHADTPPTPSGGIQMLPPMQSGAPCPAGLSRLLTWDGTNPIGCTPNISVDSGNDLIIGGGVQIGSVAPSSAPNKCLASQTGTIAWMELSGDTSSQLYACNGTIWSPVSGGSAGLYQLGCDSIGNCATINTQTAAMCDTYLAQLYECPSKGNPIPQPIGTYQIVCGDGACIIFNTATQSKCSFPWWPLQQKGAEPGSCIPP